LATSAGRVGAGGFVCPHQPAVAQAVPPCWVAGVFSQLTAIWTALAALRVLMVHFLPAEAVDAYWQRVMLPLLKLFDQNLANLLLQLGLPYFLVVLSELPVVLFGERMGRLIGWARATAGRSN